MKIILSIYVVLVGFLLILDSGAYFTTARGSAILGYAFAASIESATLALAYIRKTDFKLQYAGGLIVGLYLVSVVSAGLTVADPALKTLANSSHLAALESATQEIQNEFKTFAIQKQRGNSAITARRAEAIRNEKLALSRKNTRSTFWVWLDVILAFVSRLLVQLSAIWFASVIGGMTTRPEPKKRKLKKPQGPNRSGILPAIFIGKGFLRLPDGSTGEKAIFKPVSKNALVDQRQYVGVQSIGDQQRRFLVRYMDKKPHVWENRHWVVNDSLATLIEANRIKFFRF